MRLVDRLFNELTVRHDQGVSARRATSFEISIAQFGSSDDDGTLCLESSLPLRAGGLGSFLVRAQ
jgi:hypothetical protein